MLPIILTQAQAKYLLEQAKLLQPNNRWAAIAKAVERAQGPVDTNVQVPLDQEDLDFFNANSDVLTRKDCDKLLTEVFRLRAVLTDMAKQMNEREESDIILEEDFRQAQAMFALSHLAPMGIESYALGLASARLSEKYKLKALFEAIDFGNEDLAAKIIKTVFKSAVPEDNE